MADILTKLCIISTVLGISLLIIVSDKIDVLGSEISSITKEDINKAVKIKGIVKKIVIKGNTLSILEIEDKKSSITVVLFRPDEFIIERGSFIEVSGKVSLYKDDLQIIADTIKI